MRKIEKQYRQIDRFNKMLLDENARLAYAIEKMDNEIFNLEYKLDKKDEKIKELYEILYYQKKIIDKFFNARF